MELSWLLWTTMNRFRVTGLVVLGKNKGMGLHTCERVKPPFFSVSTHAVTEVNWPVLQREGRQAFRGQTRPQRSLCRPGSPHRPCPPGRSAAPPGGPGPAPRPGRAPPTARIRRPGLWWGRPREGTPRPALECGPQPRSPGAVPGRRCGGSGRGDPHTHWRGRRGFPAQPAERDRTAREFPRRSQGKDVGGAPSFTNVQGGNSPESLRDGTEREFPCRAQEGRDRGGTGAKSLGSAPWARLQRGTNPPRPQRGGGGRGAALPWGLRRVPARAVGLPAPGAGTRGSRWRWRHGPLPPRHSSRRAHPAGAERSGLRATGGSGTALWRPAGAASSFPPSVRPSVPRSRPRRSVPCSGWGSRRGSRSWVQAVGFRRWRPWGILTCSAPASRPPRWSSPCPAGTEAAHGRPTRLPRGVGGGGRAGVSGAGRRRAVRDALRIPRAVRGALAPALGACRARAAGNAGASSGRAGRSPGPAASPLQPAGRAPGVSAAGCCRRARGPSNGSGLCRDGQRLPPPRTLPAPPPGAGVRARYPAGV